MATLAFLFGMIPDTEKVENADDQLRADLKAYREYEGSDELKHFMELEQEVTSGDFAIRKKKILKEKYKASEEYRKEQRLKQLKKKRKKDEEPTEEMTALEKEIESDAFQKRKLYLLMKPKERYETTPESQKELEYFELKRSDKVVWFFKTKKKYPFGEIEKWEETFNESFSGTKLDEKRWMNRYYWGDAILNEPYTMFDEKSFPTDGKNVEFYDNKLRLVTRQEQVEGKKWDPLHGFMQDSFNYTSALISTGKSFRQNFGIFKAKIKMSPSDVTQAFWMVSDSLVPHIDVVKFEKGKLYSSLFWSPGRGEAPSKSVSRTGGSKFTSGFFIFSLEWSPGKLVWKINDKVFKTQTAGVPQDEMYMVFSTGLKDWASDYGLPAAMEIDWIRAYRLKEQG
ncbi:MAG: family 16 glycosylhydrolase [Bacteroidales bacterium]|nr:family 16 glycosylhydrolase [Bacteroidales bacterium]